MTKKTGYDIDNSLGMLLDWASQFMKLELNRKFTAAGIQATSEQWKILIMLWVEDELTQQQLSEKTLKNKTSVVKLVDGLERQGQVKRQPDPKDRRINRICLTPKGKATQKKMIEIAKQNLNQAAMGIDPADMTICKQVLKQIISNMRGDFHGSKS